MGRPIKKDTTDVSTVIRIIDSTAGTPETAVEHDTSGIDLWYRREGATKTSITEAALAALDSAHSDGGIEHIGDGYYRLDLPDAACATGSNGVMVGGTVTGMIVIGNYHAIVDYDPYDSVRAGLTALPNAAADAAGGLPISDAGELDLDTKLANTNEITAARMGALTDWINGGRLDLLLDAIKAVTDVLPDSGALSSLAQASVVGALDDAAAAGDPTSADTLMQYLKQLINILVGTDGIGTFPAEAAPDNAVSLAEVIRAIHADVTGLNGDAMRGTDSADVNAACDTALSDYDGPTNAEMEARTLVAANYATASGQTTIQSNATGYIDAERLMSIPSADSNSYRVDFYLKDMAGNMETPDSAPTIGAVNQAGTDRSANLSATTMVEISTGLYRVTYTVSSSHAEESISFSVSVTEGGSTRLYGKTVKVHIDYEAMIDDLYTKFTSTLSEVKSRPGKDASGFDKLGWMTTLMSNKHYADADEGPPAYEYLYDYDGNQICRSQITESGNASTAAKWEDVP